MRAQEPWRVLHVLHSGARGGGSAHLLGLLPALAREGMSPVALVGDDGPLAAQLRAQGVETCVIPQRGAWQLPRTSRCMARLARRMRASLVHVHGTRAACAWTLAQAGKRSPTDLPCLYTAHMVASAAATSAVDGAIRRRVDQFACWRKQRVICVGAEDPASFVRERLASAEQVVHVSNAIDAASFEAAGQHREHHRQQVRRALQVAPETSLLVCVARLVRQKQVTLIADALARMPQAHAVILGDGPEMNKLNQTQAAQEHRLHCVGGRDDVARWLVASDVLVLPSRWESQGIVLLEAMAAHLPWIATATSGARAVQRASQAGRLVPIGDVASLVRALQETLRAPDPAAIARGAAYARSCQWRDVARTHVQLYREALAR